MRSIQALGVLIPSHRDGAAARRLVSSLLADATGVACPVSVVVADNGGNEGFDGGLPEDPRLRQIEVVERGPGHARTAAASTLVEDWRQRGVDLDHAWIVSLDADSEIEPGFLEAWLSSIQRTTADVLSGPSFFAALNGEPGLPPEVDAASGWLWGYTGLVERFIGVVNTGGCNHAVRASTCQANGWYIQPTERHGEVEVLVPGDDWDFGLRARLRGFSVERAQEPHCLTSVRRLASDPAGFLAGYIYEGAFEPVTSGGINATWPPEADWPAIADRGRARIVAHFLLKPIMAGIPVPTTLGWFLGSQLWQELEAMPRLTRTDDWVAYRTELVARIFETETFDLARRVGRRLSGL